ncbi:DUF222 domain-containing protein [Prauserella halophila]|uniref:DUF222 domain-containing protein n=1 Tax=Prauserella halophila TaxID=185641 RepID=UPI0020A2349F|nr:DUF222 domain-containing protein [Prauserella halophila]
MHLECDDGVTVSFRAVEVVVVSAAPAPNLRVLAAMVVECPATPRTSGPAFPHLSSHSTVAEGPTSLSADFFHTCGYTGLTRGAFDRLTRFRDPAAPLRHTRRLRPGRNRRHLALFVRSNHSITGHTLHVPCRDCVTLLCNICLDRVFDTVGVVDDVMEEIERVGVVRARRARLDAEELELLAAIAADAGDDRGVAEELTPVLRVSTREVERRIEDGRSVVRRMPRLHAAMQNGEVESYGARRVLAVVGPLDDDIARQVDGLLAERLVDAPETAWQPGNLAQRVRRLVEKTDPDGQVERARRARAERKVELTPGEHAMSSLEVSLPAERAGACYSRVDAMARSLRHGGDRRTLDQLRADVAADLLLGRDPGVSPPEAAAMVYLHVPVDAALSMVDDGCELDGYGPIPARSRAKS